MPLPMGFESGYQDAMMAMFQQEEQRQGIQMNQLRMQKMLSDQAMAQQTRDLMASAFASTAGQRSAALSGSLDAGLIGGLQRAGAALMQINPEEGRRMLSEARSMAWQNHQDRQDLREVQQQQQRDIGAFAASVTDQTSLDAALPELARRGLVVPPQMRQYNPISQEWYRAKALTAAGADRALRYQLDVEKAQAAEANRQSLIENRQLRAQRNDDEATIKRMRLEGQQVKAIQGARYAPEVLGAELEAGVEGYGKLSPKEQTLLQTTLARRVRDLRTQAVRGGESLGEEEAFNQALESMRGSIEEVPETGLKGLARMTRWQLRKQGGKEKGEESAAGPPQIASEEDYAALPSGAEYITPDGKRKRKR